LRPSSYVRTFHEIELLLTTEGVIARRDHPELDTTLRYLVLRGDLIRVLPGIYAMPDRAASLQTRVRALRCLDPDAILLGAVAARLSFWPELRVEVVECAVRPSRAPQTGYSFTRRHIPRELVISRSGGASHHQRSPHWTSAGRSAARQSIRRCELEQRLSHTSIGRWSSRLHE
jgi:hypothetical protein